jgi:hypothetical protein
MKRFISLVLALMICLSVSTAAFADQSIPEDGSGLAASDDFGEPTRAEETCWYFRTVNGIRQMRLWSITYGRWLTDWIDIGPAL